MWHVFHSSREVATYNTEYVFENGPISSLAPTKANGTVSRLFNSILGYNRGSISYPSQGVDIAIVSTWAKDMARMSARTRGELAVSILASVHVGRPNLQQSFARTTIVTKVPRAFP
jgi:hypothetical protein